MHRKKPILYTLAVLFLILTIAKFTTPQSSVSTDTAFQTFTDTLFRQELSSNTLNLHYTLKTPETYQITQDNISLGTFKTNSIDTAASLENCLAALNQFNYSELSTDNQLTYDILKSYLETSLDGTPYTLYEEPLSPLTGTQSQFPILLSEYAFYREEDILTYLALLEDVPSYFDSLIAFEQAKSAAGLFMPKYAAEDVIEECKSFVGLGTSNYLYSSFENRINQLPNLTKSDIQNYISKNNQAIETYIFPSYQKLITNLQYLKKKSSTSGNLCNYPNGTGYYEHLVHCQTGSDRSITELKELTLTQIQEDLSALKKEMTTNTLSEAASFQLEDPAPKNILQNLKSKMKKTFPESPNVNLEIKYVPSEMEEYLSPAFYMIPAIDNIESNTIYINQGHSPDDLTLFTTLAHEGYPGHLYQTTYFGSTNPAPIRNLLNFGGYTEGWALYTEMLSYYLTDLPKEQATIYQRNASILLGLYALADIGIHYDGWTLLDTIDFFHKYGITNTDTIQNIYELIIGDPANYLKYYIGYVEFLELKKYAISKWGDTFSQLRFHKAVLDIGPAPFNILKEQLRTEKY